jgi:hypothetical protein
MGICFRYATKNCQPRAADDSSVDSVAGNPGAHAGVARHRGSDHKISAFSLKVNARRQANRSALGHACRDFVEHGGTLSSSPVNGLPAAFIF